MDVARKEYLAKRIKDWFADKTFPFNENSLKLESLNVRESDILLIVDSKKLTAETQKDVSQKICEKITAWEPHHIVKVLFTSMNDTSPTESSPPNLSIGRHPSGNNKTIRPQSVNKIIAVASGKGGVGKSTFVSNFACNLAVKGFKVGIIDADMHGPSQPTLLGCKDKPKVDEKTKKIFPSVVNDIKFISIGLMVPENQAVIWRGPMLMGALEQFLKDVEWGELDFLIIDLPPGTGDVQLTLSQKANIDGSVIISTPQDIALIDARKAIQMFDRLNVKIFGLIENMSTFICPKCGNEESIFGNSGVKAEAQVLNLPFLGEIPLDRKIREDSDNGLPSVLSDPTSEVSKHFSKIVDSIIERINI